MNSRDEHMGSLKLTQLFSSSLQTYALYSFVLFRFPARSDHHPTDFRYYSDHTRLS